MIIKKQINKRNIPLSGSKANEWTEVMIPDLTRNIPRRLPARERIVKESVQLIKICLKFVAIEEWIRAVQSNQGIRAEFSTGSQNHQPPQPSS